MPRQTFPAKSVADGALAVSVSGVLADVESMNTDLQLTI